MMFGAPDVWDALMRKIAGIAAAYLEVQVAAGASAVQLFDSWAGALTPADYRAHVMPHSAARARARPARSACRASTSASAPPTCSTLMGEAGADVVGVDWRTPLAAAIPLVGDRAVQGNLDPTLVFAPTEVMTARAAEVIEAGRAAQGHIFNLGHGVIPSTDPDQLKRLTEFVQSYPAGRLLGFLRPVTRRVASCGLLLGRLLGAVPFGGTADGRSRTRHRLALDLLDLDVVLGTGELDELGPAVVARVEGRVVPADVAAHRGQRRPAVVVGGRVDRGHQDPAQVRQRGGLLASGSPALSLAAEHLEVDEPVAGGDQRLGRTPPAEAVDGLAGLAQPGRQPGEVAVAGHDREAVDVAGVEQVHRVDDQRGVGGVLAGGVGELLDRLDRVAVQLVLPAGQAAGSSSRRRRA